MDKPLSLCATAMLAAIVTHEREPLNTDQLLEIVPYREPAFGLEDISKWFDELQLLLDRGLVHRQASPQGDVVYGFKVGTGAVDLVYAHMVIGVVGAA